MSFSSPVPSLEIRPHPDYTVLRLDGCDALDEGNVPTLGRQLSLLPDALTADHLVLDLEGIHYATSAALGALVAFHSRVRTAGGRLALRNVSPILREELAITRLDQLMEVRPTAARLPA